MYHLQTGISKTVLAVTFFRKSISWISHGAKVGNEHASIYKLADQAEGRVLKWHFVKLVTSKTTLKKATKPFPLISWRFLRRFHRPFSNHPSCMSHAGYNCMKERMGAITCRKSILFIPCFGFVSVHHEYAWSCSIVRWTKIVSAWGYGC